MSSTSFLHQPFTGQLGNVLSEICEKESYDSLTMAVAFAKVSGVLRLKKPLESLIKRGATVNAYIGIDLGGTSYEALIALYDICTNLYVAHVGSSQTFHPKVYAFKNSDTSLAIVGSNNLTSGGLWTNMESCSITLLHNTQDADAVTEIECFFKTLSEDKNSVAQKVTSKDYIDNLMASGLIEREMTTRIKRAKEAKRQKAEKPAGNGSIAYSFMRSIPTPLPCIESGNKSSITPSKNSGVTDVIVETQQDGTEVETDITQSKDYQSFWFETRRLTGGSRNILDLSMRAKVEKGNPEGTEYDTRENAVMGGSVMFFGVDLNTTNSVDITINYEGTDYHGNTVKFPDGDKANGTWRLQIKGVSESGEKITDAFEHGYLVDKILVFERIEKAYFTMTVFPSSDLREFMEASELVAKNGASVQARLFGLL